MIDFEGFFAGAYCMRSFFPGRLQAALRGMLTER